MIEVFDKLKLFVRSSLYVYHVIKDQTSSGAGRRIIQLYGIISTLPHNNSHVNSLLYFTFTAKICLQSL